MANELLEAYLEFVKTVEKPNDDESSRITNYGLGIAGEAADAASCIKKTIFHDNNQVEGLKENLGDTIWYIGAICNHYGWSLEEVIVANIEKLSKRYPGGFDMKRLQRKGTMVDWNEK